MCVAWTVWMQFHQNKASHNVCPILDKQVVHQGFYRVEIIANGRNCITWKSGKLRTTSWAQAFTSSPLIKDRSTPPTRSRPEKCGLLCHCSVSSSATSCRRRACSLDTWQQHRLRRLTRELHSNYSLVILSSLLSDARAESIELFQIRERVTSHGVIW